MRNKVSQEATEEMSASKGVVNLFIVFLLDQSQNVTCSQNAARRQRSAAPSSEVLFHSEKAHETPLVVRTVGASTPFGVY